MPNHMKFCSCSMCKYGRTKNWGRAIVRSVIRKFRRDAKQALKRGEEPDNKIGVPYTD